MFKSCRTCDIIWIIMLLAMALSACSGKQKKATGEESKPEGRQIEYTRELTFLNMEDKPITSIQVAVADDPSKRSAGLMDVNDLPADRGMLFIFDQEQPLSFWMANTPLALDIIFVNADMRIVRIHHNTQPFTEKNFTSDEPALYAVETNGGFCVSHDIQEGMSVTF